MKGFFGFFKLALILLVALTSFSFAKPVFAAMPDTVLPLHITRKVAPFDFFVGNFVCYAAGGDSLTPKGVLTSGFMINTKFSGDPNLLMYDADPLHPPVTGTVSYKGSIKEATRKGPTLPTAVESKIFANFITKGNPPHQTTGQGRVQIRNEGGYSLRDENGKTTFTVNCPQIKDDEDEKELVAPVMKLVKSGASGALDAAAAILIGILGGLAGQSQPSF